MGTVLSQVVTPTEEDKGGEGASDTVLEIRTLSLNSAFSGALGSVYPAVQWGRFIEGECDHGVVFVVMGLTAHGRD